MSATNGAAGNAAVPARSPTVVDEVSPVEELIGPPAAARLLGVPVSWVYANAETGRLPSFRVGKYRRFRPSELLAWLENHRGNNHGR